MSSLVAGTAPVALGQTGQFDSSKAVRCVVVDSPWTLVCAHVRLSATLTTVLGSHVGDWVV
jgi:hypothetical protein